MPSTAMSSYIDQLALRIARRIAEQENITDPRTIARYQIGAIEAFKQAYEPYSVLDETNLEDPETSRSVVSLVFDSGLPKDQWAETMDENGVALTLVRQRRWIADAIKDAVRCGRIPVSPEKKLNTKLLAALKAARGWVLNAIDSSTARSDLILIDDALDASGIDIPCTCLSDSEEDAYEPGGPMSGRRHPPACRAKTHRR